MIPFQRSDGWLSGEASARARRFIHEAISGMSEQREEYREGHATNCHYAPVSLGVGSELHAAGRC